MPSPHLHDLRGWLRGHPAVHRRLRQAALSACRWLPGARQALASLQDHRVTVPAPDYERWVRRNDTLTEADRARILAGIGRMQHRPLISILMPVYDTPEAYLRQAIESVRGQLYPDWELCIADDASPAAHVGTVLREAAASDARIRFVRRPRNGHISAASNTALGLATGEFVALMDHDDLLPSHALAAIAHAIQLSPGVQVLFSDEDKVDDKGRRTDPHFKPGWNPELLLTQNLVSHLGVYRRDRLERIGGFREGFEGSQDWDLALRATAGLPAAEVRHIPMVLYHWRQGTGAASFSESALERCAAAGRRAVAEHLELRGEPGARVQPQSDLPGWSLVAHPLPPLPPKLSLVLTRPEPDHAALRETLLLPTGLEMEILTAGEAGPLAAAQAASGEIVLFLDPALRPDHPEWLLELLAQAMRNEVGAVGPLVLDESGRVLQAGLVVDARGGEAGPVPYLAGLYGRAPGYFGHLRLPRQVSAVSGDCLALRRAVLEAALAAHAPQAGDWALALFRGLTEAGQRVVWTPRARMRHSAPFAARQAASGPRLDAGARDPFFNPNLSAAGPGLKLREAHSELGQLAQEMDAARDD